MACNWIAATSGGGTGAAGDARLGVVGVGATGGGAGGVAVGTLGLHRGAFAGDVAALGLGGGGVRGGGEIILGADELDGDEALRHRLGGVIERIEARALQIIAVDLRVSAEAEHAAVHPRGFDFLEPLTAERGRVAAQVREHARPDLSISGCHMEQPRAKRVEGRLAEMVGMGTTKAARNPALTRSGISSRS